MHAPRSRWAAHGLAALVYLGLSLVVWSGVWLHHPTSTSTCGCGDTSLLTWFMAWPAYALRHGDALFFSTRAVHPYGINLPANTSFLAISLPLTPLTWAVGPVASLNVAATLAPVATALSARALVLRWTTWAPAAFMAGLFYGFSPFVIENLTLQHVEFATLVVPPLLFWCLDELLVRQRGRAWTWGLAVAGLCVLQFFLSAELLAVCLLAAGLGTALLVGAALVSDPTAVVRRAGHAAVGLATAAGAGAVLLAYPAWYALAGPRALPRQVWPDVQYFGSAWRSLLLPADAHDRGPNPVLESYGYFGSHPLLLGYLGIGMVAVLVVGLVWFRRDRRLWFCAAMLVALEVLLARGARRGLGRARAPPRVPQRGARPDRRDRRPVLRPHGRGDPGPGPGLGSGDAMAPRPPTRHPGRLGSGRRRTRTHRPLLPAALHHPTGRRAPVVHDGGARTSPPPPSC